MQDDGGMLGQPTVPTLGTAISGKESKAPMIVAVFGEWRMFVDYGD